MGKTDVLSNDELAELCSYILDGVYLGKVSFETAIDMINELMQEHRPDGHCAKESENVQSEDN